MDMDTEGTSAGGEDDEEDERGKGGAKTLKVNLHIIEEERQAIQSLPFRVWACSMQYVVWMQMMVLLVPETFILVKVVIHEWREGMARGLMLMETPISKLPLVDSSCGCSYDIT